MSTFDNQDLFASGPHRFRVGGVSLRHALQETPGMQGVQLSALGRHGRSIAQDGDLLADDVAGLQILIDAIEDKLDGLAHELVDNLGRRWPGAVMLSFDPSPITKIGTRWRVSYKIVYLQMTP